MLKLTAAIGSLILGILFTRPLCAQTESVGRGPSDLLTYQWANLPEVAIGDTLRIRRLAFNGGEAPVELPVRICDFHFKSTAQVRLIHTNCSTEQTVIQPGDSIWAEKRWLVEAVRGSYTYEILVSDPHSGALESSLSGTWDVKDHPSSRRNGPRQLLPVVLHATGLDRRQGVSRSDIESVIDRAGSRRGYLIAFATPASAEKLARGGPHIVLQLHFGPDGDHELSVCWMQGGGQLSDRCRQSRARMSPMILGVTLNEVVTRELQRAAAYRH